MFDSFSPKTGASLHKQNEPQQEIHTLERREKTITRYKVDVVYIYQIATIISYSEV
jgi:hypothetical protein